jgi:hypothetical protein
MRQGFPEGADNEPPRGLRTSLEAFIFSQGASDISPAPVLNLPLGSIRGAIS